MNDPTYSFGTPLRDAIIKGTYTQTAVAITIIITAPPNDTNALKEVKHEQ